MENHPLRPPQSGLEQAISPHSGTAGRDESQTQRSVWLLAVRLSDQSTGTKEDGAGADSTGSARKRSICSGTRVGPGSVNDPTDDWSSRSAHRLSDSKRNLLAPRGVAEPQFQGDVARVEDGEHRVARIRAVGRCRHSVDSHGHLVLTVRGRQLGPLVVIEVLQEVGVGDGVEVSAVRAGAPVLHHDRDVEGADADEVVGLGVVGLGVVELDGLDTRELSGPALRASVSPAASPQERPNSVAVW